MNFKGSLSYFRNFIIFETFFCINRSFLIADEKLRKVLNIIFLLTITIIIGLINYDIFISKIDFGITKGLLCGFMIFELAILAMGSRSRKTFNTIQILDNNCGVSEKFGKSIAAKVTIVVVTSILAAILNTVTAIWMQMEPSLGVIIVMVTTVHDSEMDFLRLIIEGFNLRLMDIKNVKVAEGSKIYRTVVLTTTQLSEEFNSSILIMLGVTMIKTMMYAVYVSYSLFTNKDIILAVLLAWRQLKSLTTLTFLCAAAGSTKNICKNLAFHLASKLVLDPGLKKDKHRKQYDMTRRLYRSVLKEQPSYGSGAIQSIDLSVPVRLIDVSINYLLIFIQIYLAYYR